MVARWRDGIQYDTRANQPAATAVDVGTLYYVTDESLLERGNGTTWDSVADSSPVTTHEAAADPHTGYQKESEKSAASGYASLDSATKVPIAELPTGVTSSHVALGDHGHTDKVDESEFTAAGDILVGTGAGTLTARKNNDSATTAPTATDDSAAGYAVGSMWFDVTNDKWYGCLDATATAAVWQEVGSGGAVATDAIFDAKGDLAVGTGADTASKLTVGADGDTPRAASGETTGIEWVKNNIAAAAAPGATDDSAAGYSVGSRWIDTTADKEYVCLDATATAAVWTETTQSGGASPSFVGVRAYRTTALSLTSGSLATVGFDAESHDSDGFHDTVTNNHQFTVPTGKADYYSIRGGGEWSSVATSGRLIRLLVGGLTVKDKWTAPGGSAGVHTDEVEHTMYLAVGDVVTMQALAYTSSITFGSATASRAAFLELRKVA